MATFLLSSPLKGSSSQFVAAIGARDMKIGSRGLFENARAGGLFIVLIGFLCREILCSANPCATTYNGDVPNPNDPTCITYYNCWDYDITTQKTCDVINGDQFLFNPATGYCDWPSSFTCNGGSGTSSTATDRCISTSSEDWICNGR